MDPVAKFSSNDGRRTVTVFARSDGLYQFREAVLMADEWLPGRISGLFQTRGDAEAGAYAAANCPHDA